MELERESRNIKIVNGGIAPSGCLAFVLSWALNHSFWWAILHALFGWFYIVYAVCTQGNKILPALAGLFR